MCFLRQYVFTKDLAPSRSIVQILFWPTNLSTIFCVSLHNQHFDDATCVSHGWRDRCSVRPIYHLCHHPLANLEINRVCYLYSQDLCKGWGGIKQICPLTFLHNRRKVEMFRSASAPLTLKIELMHLKRGNHALKRLLYEIADSAQQQTKTFGRQ